MKHWTKGFGFFSLGVLVTSLWTVGLTAKEAAPKAQVVSLEQALLRMAPSKKASIRILSEGENAFVGYLTMNAGGKVPEHRDPTEDYIYILEGSGTITIDGEKSEVKAGSAVYMPAKAKVSFENGDKELKALQVFAGPASAAKYEKWPVKK